MKQIGYSHVQAQQNNFAYAAATIDLAAQISPAPGSLCGHHATQSPG